MYKWTYIYTYTWTSSASSTSFQNIWKKRPTDKPNLTHDFKCWKDMLQLIINRIFLVYTYIYIYTDSTSIRNWSVEFKCLSIKFNLMTKTEKNLFKKIIHSKNELNKQTQINYTDQTDISIGSIWNEKIKIIQRNSMYMKFNFYQFLRKENDKKAPIITQFYLLSISPFVRLYICLFIFITKMYKYLYVFKCDCLFCHHHHELSRNTLNRNGYT